MMSAPMHDSLEPAEAVLRKVPSVPLTPSPPQSDAPATLPSLLEEATGALDTPRVAPSVYRARSANGETGFGASCERN